MTNSLLVRILFAGIIWISVALGISGWIIKSQFDRSALRQFDARLERQLNLLTAAIAETGGDPSSRMTNPDFSRVYSGSYWQVFNLDGDIFRSRSLWDVDLPIRQSGPTISRKDILGPDNQSLRQLTVGLVTPDNKEWTLSIAESKATLEADISAFSRALLISELSLGVALLLAATILLRTALYPLQKLRNAISRRKTGIHTKIADQFPNEIAPLVNDLNDMLSKNERLKERGRLQAANLAHALKTPATILANEITKARRGEPIDTELSSQAIENISAAADRHLSLASPSAEDVAKVGSTNIQKSACEVANALKRIFPNIAFNLSNVDDINVEMERSDVLEILGNLMENAGKWAKNNVVVTAKLLSGTVNLQIEDDGCGVPKRMRDTILKQGIRLDENKSGTGLGLAIVTDIVERYRGRIELGESSLGGLQINLQLPAGH